jgi:hypothetical protein
VKKPRRYGDFGVPEYWVADPIAREVLVWRFDVGAVEPERLVGPFEWRPATHVEPLTVDRQICSSRCRGERVRPRTWTQLAMEAPRSAGYLHGMDTETRVTREFAEIRLELRHLRGKSVQTDELRREIDELTVRVDRLERRQQD